MTKNEAQTIAKQKAANLKNGQMIRITPEADFNYWVMRYRDGSLYIGYFVNEPMPAFYSFKDEVAERNQKTGEVSAYWQRLDFHIQF